MPRIEGAYRLGKAFLEEIQTWEDMDADENDNITATPRNTGLVIKAVKDAARNAGFMNLFFMVGAMDCHPEKSN
jgi:hypothetical protein